MDRMLENIREVLHIIRQYRSRTAMTLFGLVWGTMTVILLLAFGVGVQRAMSRNMHGLGEGIAICWPGRTSIPFEGYGRDRWIRLKAEDMVLLKQEIWQINACSPEYSRWNTPVRVKDKINSPNITGIVPEYGPMRHVWPQPGGRFINEKDLAMKRRVVFLGNDLKDFLFGKDDPAVGRYVFIGETPFLVIGVLIPKTQNSSYNQRDKDRAFIPATTFTSLFGDQPVSNFVYQISDPRIGKQVQTRVYSVLARKYRFDPDDRETLHVWDTTEMDRFIFYFSLGMNIFLGIIGCITLVVGGIGLANIMYVGVQERTREIGIKRSIGAKRRHILGQFILEAFFIIGMGAVIGFALALVIIRLLSLLPIEDTVGHPVLNLPVALITVAILSLIGFLAGFFPARKASRLEVVECLRY